MTFSTHTSYGTLKLKPFRLSEAVYEGSGRAVVVAGMRGCGGAEKPNNGVPPPKTSHTSLKRAGL
jgi:hypothetical protein